MPSSLKWIVKLDDDVIVNITKLDEYLSKGNNDQEALHCQIKSPTGIIHKFSYFQVSKFSYIFIIESSL